MSIEDRVMDVLLTASFADADARLACEEKLRAILDKPKPADYAELLATLLRYQSAIVCADDDLNVGPAMCANAFDQAAAAIRSLIWERDVARVEFELVFADLQNARSMQEAAEKRLADAVALEREECARIADLGTTTINIETGKRTAQRVPSIAAAIRARAALARKGEG